MKATFARANSFADELYLNSRRRRHEFIRVFFIWQAGGHPLHPDTRPRWGGMVGMKLLRTLRCSVDGRRALRIF